jgi:hypothetical protein
MGGGSVTGYMTYLVVEAQESQRAEQVRLPRATDDARIGARPPSRLRTRTARLLVGLAMRLDDRLQPTAVRASTAGART